MRSSVRQVIDRCDHCNGPYTPAQRHQRFCREACKVAWHRAQAKARRDQAAEAPRKQHWMDWVEATLKVPAGILAGEPFRMTSWQRQFFEEATKPDIREAGLSIARKNGKSAIIGAYVIAHLCGPLNTGNWRALVTSIDADKAVELRDQIVEILEASELIDNVKVYRGPGPGSITGMNGARVKFLAANLKSSGHAAGGDLVIFDEGGLASERYRPLWNAMFTSISGRDGRMMVISIQGDGPMFKELRERGDQRDVYFQLHAPPADAAIDDEEAWHLGNPGLKDGIKSIEYMRSAAAKAKISPPDQAYFRAYDLNLPQDPGREMICTPQDWQRLIVPTLPERKGMVVIGLDLGGSASMTAAALYWPLSGRLECYGAFPDDPPLGERGSGDGCGDLYCQMEARGELKTFPGKTTPVHEFLTTLAIRIAGSDIAVLAADRFRKAEVLQTLAVADLAWPIEWRGQGWLDGSEDVRQAQREIFEARPKTLESLMLESAIAESAIVRDPAGNGKLDRAHRRGRIDALQAAVLALSAGRRLRPDLETRREPKISFL